LVTFGAIDQDIAGMNRGFFLHDAALLAPLGRSGVPLDEVDALYDDPAGDGIYFQDFAHLPAIISRYNHYCIALANFHNIFLPNREPPRGPTLEDLRSEGDDLHELSLPQFSSHWTEYASSPWLSLLVN
jgi:hypothetical protein